MLIDAAFEPIVAHLDLAELEAGADQIFMVDPDLIIRAVNSAYVEFGLANGFPEVRERATLGCDLAAAIHPPVRDLIVERFARSLASATPIHDDYECSSAETFREFRQSIYPLPRRGGLVVSNHLIHATPHPDRPEQFGAAHLSPTGTVSQCCQCRKVRNWTRSSSWDWIPTLVASTDPRVSHTFCEHCRDHYYPDID